jgi:multidrug efflux pump subunit AcrA (membrane-fusion protein)
MPKLISKFALPLLILGAAVAVAVGLVMTKPKATPVEIKEKAWLVSVQPVEPKTWSPSLTLYGRVESLWSSALTAGMAADVVEVAVIEGDDVAKGQLLVQLDDRDAKLALAQREAELREAEARIGLESTRHASNLEALPRERNLLSLTQADLKRAQDLLEKKAGSQANLDAARQAVERQAITVTQREQAIREHTATLAQLEAARAKAQALRDTAVLELVRARVVAPFNGRIAQVLVSPGKRVRVGDSLVELYDTEAMVVRAQVPTRHLPAVREARSAGAELRVRGSIDRLPVRAKLLRLAGQADSASGGVEALFAMEGGADVLRQGRFVRLDLQMPPQPALVALPHEAVYGRNRIYRMDTDSRMRPLTVARVGETRTASGSPLVLIRSKELRAGDQVVTTRLPNAIDGLLVRVPAKGG